MAASVRCTSLFFGLTVGRPSGEGLVDGAGPTVGKRLDGLVGLLGDTPVPGIPGRTVGGRVGVEPGGAVADDARTTMSDAQPLTDLAPFAVIVTVSWTCSLRAALAPTGTTARSSSACAVARVPSLHVALSRIGHTENRGAPRAFAEATCSATLTLRPGAFRVHTQTAKLARLPGLTCDEPDKDCTWTQSTGGFGFGLGEGLGLVGEGLGLVVFDVSLGAGLGLVLSLGLELVRADELLGEPVGLLRAEALRSAEPEMAIRLALAAVSAALFGMVEQARLVIGEVPKSAASASPDELTIRKAKPVSAPYIAGFASCALTCATSFRVSCWPERKRLRRPNIMHWAPIGIHAQEIAA